MKNLLLLLALFLTITFSFAQNNNEAKMAFQMAEEKFESKYYEEALDFLNKAEKALGSVNPPMAYLKVMIVDQLASENVNNEESKDALSNLEKALTVFDKTKGKDNLGEQKLMAIYRIKTDLDKRKEAHQKWEDSLVKQYQIFQKMIYRLASEYPKTDITVGEFVSHPMAWNAPDAFYKNKLKEKDVNRWVKWGGTHPYFGLTGGSFSYSDLKLKQLYMESFKTTGEGIDNIKEYLLKQFIKKGPRKSGAEPITQEQIIELFNIPKELWDGIIWNENTFIESLQDWYRISFKSEEKKTNGEFKQLIIGIHKMIDKTDTSNAFGGGQGSYECLSIKVIENTL